MRKTFTNKETGKAEEFELVEGQWVPVAPAAAAAAAGPIDPATLPQRQGGSAGSTAIDFLQGMGQGVTLGAADELRGLLEGGIAGLASGGESASEAYNRAAGSSRETFAQNAAESPWATGGGQFVGGAAVPLPGAGWASRAPSALSALGRISGLGAAQGGLTGALSADPGQRGRGAAVGAGVGLAAPAAIALPASVAGGIARGAWRGATESAPARATRQIREHAVNTGVSAPGVAARMAENPALTPADVDPSLRRLMIGNVLGRPAAERVARQVLDPRQEAAPARITGYLEQASRLGPQERIGPVEARIAQSQRTLGPEYERLGRESIPVTPRLQSALDTGPLRRAYSKALENWQARNVAPGIDPLKDHGILTGDIVQEMKKTAEKTIYSPSASQDDKAAARAVRDVMLEEADIMVPNYPALRDQYGAEVMQPRAGVELGRQLYTGTDDTFRELQREAQRLTPAGREGYLAGALEDARQAAVNRPGGGDQFYGGKLTGTELATQRARELTGGDIPRAGELLRQIENERLMHETRALATKGSKTAGSLQAMREAEGAGAVLTAADMKAGGLISAASRLVESLTGNSSAVAEATTRQLLRAGMSRTDIEALLSGRVTKSMNDYLLEQPDPLRRAAAGATSAYLMQ